MVFNVAKDGWKMTEYTKRAKIAKKLIGDKAYNRILGKRKFYKMSPENKSAFLDWCVDYYRDKNYDENYNHKGAR